METTFPSVAPFLRSLSFPRPSPILKPSSMAQQSHMESSDSTSSLPKNYEAVPDLLRRIEKEAKQAVSDTDAVDAENKTHKIPIVSTTVTTPTVEVSSPTVEVSSLQSRVESRVEDSSNDVVSPPGLPIAAANVAAPDPVKTASSDAVCGDATEGRQGMGKLARLLGKGDFQTENIEKRDVMDGSEYMKPGPWRGNTEPTTTPATCPIKRPPAAVSASLDVPPVPETYTLTEGEVDAGGRVEEIEGLKKELETQMKWEAVRLQHAVHSQMMEDGEIAKKKAAEVERRHGEEIDRLKEEARVRAEEMVKLRIMEVKQQYEKGRDEEVLQILKEKEREMREALVMEYADSEREKIEKRENELQGLKTEIGALVGVFDGVVKQTERAKEGARRAGSAFLLTKNVGLSQPLGRLVTEARDDCELGLLVAASVPEGAMKHGVSSLEKLQASYKDVAKHGLSAAMVPENKVGMVWAHLLGAIFSRLKISVDGRIDLVGEPQCNEERIRIAGRYVNEGDLGGAVETLDSLNGLSREVMQGWIADAKARVAADLAADVLLADAIIAQMTLAKGEQTE